MNDISIRASARKASESSASKNDGRPASVFQENRHCHRYNSDLCAHARKVASFGTNNLHRHFSHSNQAVMASTTAADPDESDEWNEEDRELAQLLDALQSEMDLVEA